MATCDFLFELGTQELPASALQTLAQQLQSNMTLQCQEKQLSFKKITSFATPRRLAIFIEALSLAQKEQIIEKRGPHNQAPTQALAGFARSCGTDVDHLIKKQYQGQDYFYYLDKRAGQSAQALLPDMIKNSVNQISIDKTMRWGVGDYSFSRPVMWLVALLSDKVLPMSLFGLESTRFSYGLRAAKKSVISIDNASSYRQQLWQEASIEVDFLQRKKIIEKQITTLAKKHHANVCISDALLDEVCALVESPQALLGFFDERFLTLPQMVLIAVMEKHQKSFYLLDDKKNTLPMFITVANLLNADKGLVVKGNERVIDARLSDALFFIEQDKKKPLSDNVESLKRVVFMASLGSMADKTGRVSQLTKQIADEIGADVKDSLRAATLAKADLPTDIVAEFADLQGLMGGYYAALEGEKTSVCQAIAMQYHPRFSRDSVPKTKEAMALAIADKLDTIVGVFSVGRQPSGNKDPFALRRLALGVARIIIENQLVLDIKALLAQAQQQYQKNTKSVEIEVIYLFMVERLRLYYQDKQLTPTLFDAVLACQPIGFYDFHQRLTALSKFYQNEQAVELVALYKRIRNITKGEVAGQLDDKILVIAEEKKLYQLLEAIKQKKATLNYEQLLAALLKLKPAIADFFATVMVKVDDVNLKKTRLTLLIEIQTLFLAVADISYLN